MAFERAKIKQLDEGLFLIDDAGSSTCFVVCGEEKAMVIDTVNGMEDLHEIVRTVTQLPLIVANTHGHPDHMFGNWAFEEAWIHPADAKLAEGFYEMVRKEMGIDVPSSCPLRFLAEGQIFDLGGTQLEVVPMYGHTPGSVGFLDRKRRVLFSGDAVNPHLWMQLDHCLSIAELRRSLVDFRAKYGEAFDRVLNGHCTDYTDAGCVDRVIKGCDQLLAGETQDDDIYPFYDGKAKQHIHTTETGERIVYTDESLR